MKSDEVAVSYRDKATSTNVSLGKISVDIPETVTEAIALYGEGDEAKGIENLLEYASTAYVIEKQRLFRDAQRPDKPKSNSNLSKFKQLSHDKQEELLRQAGIIE